MYVVGPGVDCVCISRILEMYSIVVAIVFRSSWVQVHLELCLVILNVVRADSGCGTVAGHGLGP